MTDADGFSGFLQELQEGGEVTEVSTGFTLRSDKAREKLKKFALAHPENYFLLLIGGLHTLGARELNLRVDADDLELQGDARVSREELKELWSCVAGGGQNQNRQGLRLLALSILTSVRFESADWRIECSDDEGGFVFQQQVRSGDLPEPIFAEQAVTHSGIRVVVKRKSFGQVARRFFSQLVSRLHSQPWQEEKMIAERAFLGIFHSFQLNGRSLNCGLLEEPVLAIRRIGEVPEFLESHFSYRGQGKYPLAAVISEPDGWVEPPGLPGHIQWLWHGLKMGQTDLKLPYKFCRVYLCADGMQTDLSFTAIPDTWERQAAERAAREAVRDLLKNLAREYTEHQGEGRQSCHAQLEEILLEVMAERIDVQRSRHRLGSFNKALIECPVFWGVDGGGCQKRFTLNELWERVEKGGELASFESESEVEPVPDWPGLPLILIGSPAVHRTLSKIFGRAHLEAGRLVRRVKRLLERAAATEQERQSRKESTHRGPRGSFSWAGVELEWTLDLDAPLSEPGTLQVPRGSRVFFEDGRLDLPPGLVLRGPLPWKPDHYGRLSDLKLARGLEEAALAALVDYLGGCKGEPSSGDLRVLSLIWKILGADVRNWRKDGLLFDTPWIATVSAQGWCWQSPRELFADSEDAEPLYLVPTPLPETFHPEVYPVPCPLVPFGLWESLERYLARKVVGARGWELLSARGPSELEDGKFLLLEYPQDQLKNLNPDLVRAQVGFPLSGTQHSERLLLFNNLRKHALATKSLTCAVEPISVRLDWEAGWVGSRGLHFVDKEHASKANEIAEYLVLWAARELVPQLSLERVGRVTSKSLGLAWFECWTDEDLRGVSWVLLSDGSKTSPSEICASEAPVAYFSLPSELDRAGSRSSLVWLPAQVAKASELLSDKVKFYHFLDSPPEEDRRESPAEVEVESPVGVQGERTGVCEETSAEGLEEDAPASDPVPTPQRDQEAEKERSEPTKRQPEPAEKKPGPVKVEIAEEAPAQAAVPKLLSATVQDEVAGFQDKVSAPPVAGLPVEHASSERAPVLPAYHAFLVEVFEELPSPGPAFPLEEFRQFLLAVDWVENAAASLIDDGGRINLTYFRSPLNGRDPRVAMLLLSGLFSVFNRHTEEVRDFHERAFHRSVLSRCEELFLGALNRQP